VGIAQLVAHAEDECILYVRGGDAALPKLLWDFLLYVARRAGLPRGLNYVVFDKMFHFANHAINC